MTKNIMLAACALVALGTTACSTYSTAVTSVQGKAFVKGSGIFDQTMFLCDATSGKPVCKELEEQE
ncbi:hypothetical protein [Chondromyces apiculatus]|uniref:Lipoprotein n=1 Tax=Chondromyces apiculatus DSM 436 TaxID=1192034 RepID=A0A017T3S0_9BACT|nr:hypothetical protein [Chondromyces apiculatus]EYF03893.1 Hypothetical protein CAP_5157 [Chondromyces apiculatus DSM 436]